MLMANDPTTENMIPEGTPAVTPVEAPAVSPVQKTPSVSQELTSDAPAPATNDSPTVAATAPKVNGETTPPQTAAQSQPEKDNMIGDIEKAVAEEYEEVKHLTEEDIRRAFHWILGAMPPSFVESFYLHHPKFKP